MLEKILKYPTLIPETTFTTCEHIFVKISGDVKENVAVFVLFRIRNVLSAVIRSENHPCGEVYKRFEAISKLTSL